MRGLLWPLALIVTFGLGLAAGGVAGKGQSGVQEVDHLRATVSRLQEQVSNLQARLRAREANVGAVQHSVTTRHGGAPQEPYPGAEARPVDRLAAAATAQERAPRQAGSRAHVPSGPQDDRVSSQRGPRGTVNPAPTVEAALDRFYRYLEATNGSEWRERRPQARELVDQLRAMGDAGAQALLQVLASGSDSDERRAAARLLGTLQVPQALPLLRDVLQTEDDVLLRRAAASGLRQLQTPESIPVMEALLANPGEDRFVRMSAAYGLAQAGKPQGVTGLVQIFEESNTDGRGREMAFRSLASLSDERSLPFMRQLVTSQAEPSYRLQAIRSVTAQGDRQALGALQQVMQSPTEQASIRDAAAQAYAAIAGK